MSKADGQKIGIKFTQSIISDAATCDIDAFSVSGQEHNYEPGGILVTGDYVVDSVAMASAENMYEESFSGGSSSNIVVEDDLTLMHTGGEVANGLLTAPSPGSGIEAWYEIGWKFTVGSEDIVVPKLRLKLPGTATRNVHLWRVSDHALLGSVSITTSGTAWAEGELSSPVTLSAGASYIVSVYTYTWYYSASSNFTFNSKITYNSSAATTSENTYPSPEAGSNVYGFADIVIGTPLAYSTSGYYRPARIDISSYTQDVRLQWTATVPTGTSVTVEYALTTGAEPSEWTVVASSNDLIDLPSSPSGYYLWLRYTLATSDPTTTPTLSRIWVEYENSDPTVITITLNALKRFLRVRGDITVSYDSSIGNLSGAGGPVASFSMAFTPVDLVNKPHPNDPENIEITSISATGTMTAVTYHSAYNDGENIQIASIAATGTLTNINDL